MALVLGSSTYAFSAMLFVFLASIGIGSLFYTFIARRFSNSKSTILFVVTTIVASTIVGVRLLPTTAQCVGALMPMRANDFANGVICVLGSVVLQLVPGLGMGILFPLLVNMAQQNTTNIGNVVGKVYAWNTAGSIIGCLVTTVWLIPMRGFQFATLIALILYISIPMATEWKVQKIKFVSLAVLCGLMVLLGIFGMSQEDPRKLNMGMFMYGYQAHDSLDEEVLFFKEGISSNVLVTRHNGRTTFRVNGKADGSSGGDMSMQLGLAYFPLFLNPEAKDVLVVGYGTGSTSGACLLFPNTFVTCCELEPAIIAAAEHFSDVNHQPHKSSRFKVVFDDARSYIQGTDQTYDLILSEPSNPWVAGVSNLYTREFYQQARTKLSKNGIFAQWIQTYSFTP
ncbi:MAG: hypothetical protein FJ267_16180, partial [Planctomycetes bacterium]|nr:hypothetical protein [Planctomycetota bacterium]